MKKINPVKVTEAYDWDLPVNYGGQPNTAFIGNPDHAHLKPNQRRGDFYYQKRVDLIDSLSQETLIEYQREFEAILQDKKRLIDFYGRWLSRRNADLAHELLQEGKLQAWTWFVVAKLYPERMLSGDFTIDLFVTMRIKQSAIQWLRQTYLKKIKPLYVPMKDEYWEYLEGGYERELIDVRIGKLFQMIKKLPENEGAAIIKYIDNYCYIYQTVDELFPEDKPNKNKGMAKIYQITDKIKHWFAIDEDENLANMLRRATFIQGITYALTSHKKTLSTVSSDETCKYVLYSRYMKLFETVIDELNYTSKQLRDYTEYDFIVVLNALSKKFEARKNVGVRIVLRSLFQILVDLKIIKANPFTNINNNNSYHRVLNTMNRERELKKLQEEGWLTREQARKIMGVSDFIFEEYRLAGDIASIPFDKGRSLYASKSILKIRKRLIEIEKLKAQGWVTNPSEIAKAVGVSSPQTVLNWINRHPKYKPYKVTAKIRLYGPDLVEKMKADIASRDLKKGFNKTNAA